jgi:Fe-S-cluster containining protein
MTGDYELKRNECSCKICKLSCRVMPGFLLPNDLMHMMEVTGLIDLSQWSTNGDSIRKWMTSGVSKSPSQFALATEIEPEDVFKWAEKHLYASEGAVVRLPGSPLKDGSNAMRIPTLVPKSRKNGHCIHYTRKGECAIHADSPFGCRMFDCKMPIQNAKELSLFAVSRLGSMWAAVLEDRQDSLNTAETIYAATFIHLSSRGMLRPQSTLELRAKLKREGDKIMRKEQK